METRLQADLGEVQKAMRLLQTKKDQDKGVAVSKDAGKSEKTKNDEDDDEDDEDEDEKKDEKKDKKDGKADESQKEKKDDED